MRIVIVGSGIGGLSMALALRNLGHEIELFERTPALTEVGAGISLWANALRALDHIDPEVGQAVRAVSLRMVHSEFRVNQGHRKVLSFEAKTFEDRFKVTPFVAMIHRAELVETLAKFVDPKTTHYGHTCDKIEMTTDGIVVQFTNGHSTRADLVIGADGIRSAVRKSLHPPTPPRYSGYTCWRGIAPRPKLIQAGEIHEWWGRGKRFGITTLPQDRVYWFAVHNETEGGKNTDEKSALKQLFEGWADPIGEILETTPTEKIIRNDIVDRPPAKGWHNERLVLIGDAAHPTTPNFGQGGCMAIEDSVVLARCLHLYPELPKALAAFEKERYARTTAITKESWKFGKIGQWQGKWSCRFRDTFLRMIMPLIATRSLPKYAVHDVGPIKPNQSASN